MKEFITENLSTVIAIVTLIIGSFSVITASFKKAKKEVLEVIAEYKKAMLDGKLSEKEAEVLIKELGEAIEASTKFTYLVIGIFKKKAKK